MKFIQRFKVVMCLLTLNEARLTNQASPSAFQFFSTALSIDIIDGRGLSSEVMNGMRNVLFT